MTLLYQPVVWLEDRSVAGFEALLRWDHPKMGRLVAPPISFRSLKRPASSSRLGLFALDRATRQLAVWQARDAACAIRCFLQRQHFPRASCLRHDLDPGPAARCCHARAVRARHTETRVDRSRW